jgi:hypothetical protein
MKYRLNNRIGQPNRTFAPFVASGSYWSAIAVGVIAHADGFGTIDATEATGSESKSSARSGVRTPCFASVLSQKPEIRRLRTNMRSLYYRTTWGLV